MPKTGMSRSKTAGGSSSGGASSAYTDAGPPERMIATGFFSWIFASGTSWEITSE